jgi:hypothetical protein
MSELPDTAMATGNDEGEPGRPDTRPLAEDERVLLEELKKSAGGEPAVDDRPEVAAPAAADAGGNDDGLDLADGADRLLLHLGVRAAGLADVPS